MMILSIDEVGMNSIYQLKTIETQRLIIRPVQLGDDIELNYAINNSLEVLKKWMPWADNPSLEATREFVISSVAARKLQDSNHFPVVIIHKENQRIIGASGFNERSDFKKGIYEIGYWCDVDYQGQGYVSECVNALTYYALDELQAKVVVIRVSVDNVKSIAVPKRLNFNNQGQKPAVIKDGTMAYYFTCENKDVLPPLKFLITHDQKNT